MNCNCAHWTVLQRDPSSGAWVRTNSIEGTGLFYGRAAGLDVRAVADLLRQLGERYGRITLHRIVRADIGAGIPYLDREGRRALLPLEEEASTEIAGSAAPENAPTEGANSFVICSVDGIGLNDTTPAARLEQILDAIMAQSPSVILLQEVVLDTITVLHARLPGWQLLRRQNNTADYFNVTAISPSLRAGAGRMSSMAFPYSAYGASPMFTQNPARTPWSGTIGRSNSST